jgi:hypothetical protein
VLPARHFSDHQNGVPLFDSTDLAAMTFVLAQLRQSSTPVAAAVQKAHLQRQSKPVST